MTIQKETILKIAKDYGIDRMIFRTGANWIAIEVPPRFNATLVRQLFQLHLKTNDFILIGKLNFLAARINKFQIIQGGLYDLAYEHGNYFIVSWRSFWNHRILRKKAK